MRRDWGHDLDEHVQHLGESVGYVRQATLLGEHSTASTASLSGQVSSKVHAVHKDSH